MTQFLSADVNFVDTTLAAHYGMPDPGAGTSKVMAGSIAVASSSLLRGRRCESPAPPVVPANDVRRVLLPRYDRRRTPPAALRLCIRKSWSYQVLGLERRIGKRRQRRAELERRRWANPIHRARVYARELADGRRTYQQVADRFGVTRSAVCQYLAIIKRLPTDPVQAMEVETSPDRLRALSMKRLVRIARLDTEEARRAAVAGVLGTVP